MSEKARPIDMLPPRDPSKNKGMEKDISFKWKGEKGWDSNTYIQQNRL